MCQPTWYRRYTEQQKKEKKIVIQSNKKQFTSSKDQHTIQKNARKRREETEQKTMRLKSCNRFYLIDYSFIKQRNQICMYEIYFGSSHYVCFFSLFFVKWLWVDKNAMIWAGSIIFFPTSSSFVFAFMMYEKRSYSGIFQTLEIYMRVQKISNKKKINHASSSSIIYYIVRELVKE